jgi:nicotinamide mononucleotide transporter
MTFLQFFSVETIMFTVMGYQMSWLEFLGTILNLSSVYLIARKNMFTWPIGIVAVVLFALLFYQIRLYADFFEQIYYFFASIYGWWLWSRNKGRNDETETSWSDQKTIVFSIVLTLAASAGLSVVIGNLHIWFPVFFTAAATYVEIDSFTTIASFIAMLLMAHKRTECWIYWLVVNVISIWLYYVKGVVFVSGLYAIFLVLAIIGLRSWTRKNPTNTPEKVV